MPGQQWQWGPLALYLETEHKCGKCSNDLIKALFAYSFPSCHFFFFVKLTAHFLSSLASAARLHPFSGRLEKYERPQKRPRECRTFPGTRPRARLGGRPTHIRLWAGALIKDAQRKDKKTLKVVQRGLKITLFSRTRTRHAHKARKSPAKSFHLIISSSVYNAPNVFFHPVFPLFHSPPIYICRGKKKQRKGRFLPAARSGASGEKWSGKKKSDGTSKRKWSPNVGKAKTG